MNIEQKEAVIKFRLEQAAEAIQNAELLLKNGAHAAAINRIYYGMFYAVLAMALRYRFDTSKHGQLIGWFNREFVKTGQLEHRLFIILKTAFDRRSEADYELSPLPSPPEIESMLLDMKTFIATIKAWLEANPSEP